jgi:hypothetical protein
MDFAGVLVFAPASRRPGMQTAPASAGETAAAIAAR